MSQVLHDIEKKIIEVLKSKPNQTTEQLSEITELSIDQIRRGIEWLRLKDLANVSDSTKKFITLGKNGLEALKNGLPERKLISLIHDSPKSFDEIRSNLSGLGFNAAIANARKNGWVKIEKTESGQIISKKEEAVETPEEKLLSFIGEKNVSDEEIENKMALKFLMNRPDFIIEHEETTKSILLSNKGKEIDFEKADSGAIDVEANVPSIHPARIHPLKDVINEIRETFVNLGFTEIFGDLSQPSFWNFDALFLSLIHISEPTRPERIGDGGVWV